MFEFRNIYKERIVDDFGFKFLGLNNFYFSLL